MITSDPVSKSACNNNGRERGFSEKASDLYSGQFIVLDPPHRVTALGQVINSQPVVLLLLDNTTETDFWLVGDDVRSALTKKLACTGPTFTELLNGRFSVL